MLLQAPLEERPLPASVKLWGILHHLGFQQAACLEGDSALSISGHESWQLGTSGGPMCTHYHLPSAPGCTRVTQ